MANISMIDTNVILDVFTQREPFYEDSKRILLASANKEIDGIISANTILDIFYIYHKHSHNIQETYKIIGKLLKIFSIGPVLGIDIYKAYDQKTNDFEDCVLAEVGKACKCDFIITRDKKGFKDLGIPIYTPKEAIKLLNLK